MSGPRFVRFASFGSADQEEGEPLHPHEDEPLQVSYHSAVEQTVSANRLPASYAPPQYDNVDGGGGYVEPNSNMNMAPSQSGGNISVSNTGSGGNTAPRPRLVNRAIEANDGPSLAAALAQSIRHHAKLIDGEQQANQPSPAAKRGMQRRAYDPYEDDDHVSLAPGVELNYEKEAAAQGAPQSGAQTQYEQERVMLAPALRDFVANAGVEESNDGSQRRRHIDSTVEKQQERIDMLNTSGRDSLGNQLKSNISNWFGIDGSYRSGDGGGGGSSAPKRSVRFAGDENDELAAALVGGESATFGAGTASIVGRSPKFIVPPPTSFRTATRHPSHLPPDEYDNLESRLNAPRRLLAARKRHRRNDSFLRLMVAIFCFGLSLTFAIIYGEGKFGMTMTTMAYNRKVAVHGYDDDTEREGVPDDGDVFYPAWWESERGIPDMESKNIKFSSILEYHAADVASPRAPDRIETPFFWFVPRSGGNVIRTVMAQCLRLAEASEYGADYQANLLRIEVQDERKFVNVDMSTSSGLQHAKDLKLASTGVADVVISGDIHGVLNVFNNRNRARVFAVLRNPLERAISKYYADVASDPDVAGMTLPQYVRSTARVENNYLTRYLSGRYGGNLEVKHLNIARELLRRKVVVGLSSNLPATANLFTNVFGWNTTAATLGLANVDVCYNHIFNLLKDKSPPAVEEGSEGWTLLIAQNWFDLKVYEYAEHLFEQQLDQLKLPRAADAEGEVAARM